MTPASLFSVPVWRANLPNFNGLKDAFLVAVKKYKESNPISDSKSNSWGYQSPKEIHSLSELRPLFNFVTEMAQQSAESIGLYGNIAIMEAWANFNCSRQCMNNQHIHGGVFSGIFYLNAPAESGKLALINPGINGMWEGMSLIKHPGQYTSESMLIQPTEGEVIMWPSYLPHSVSTNNHDEARISIAFNLYSRK